MPEKRANACKVLLHDALSRRSPAGSNNVYYEVITTSSRENSRHLWLDAKQDGIAHRQTLGEFPLPVLSGYKWRVARGVDSAADDATRVDMKADSVPICFIR
jgi:hypothetical protein